MKRPIKTSVSICLSGFLLAAALIAPPRAVAQETRYTVMAAFLFNFLLFTEWPEHDSLDDGPFVIGVVGSNPFERAAPTLEQRNAGGRSIRFVHYENIDDLEPTHILFVTPAVDAHLADIRSALADAPVVLVGESSDFTQRGGVIRFFKEVTESTPTEKTLRVEINRHSATARHIRFRSQLLRLAHVVDHPVPADELP